MRKIFGVLLACAALAACSSDLTAPTCDDPAACPITIGSGN